MGEEELGVHLEEPVLEGGRLERVDLPDLAEDVEELARDGAPARRPEMAQASAYDCAASTGRTGAGNTDDFRGPRLRRASASTGRGASGASPIGMSMAAAVSRPSSS